MPDNGNGRVVEAGSTAMRPMGSHRIASTTLRLESTPLDNVGQFFARLLLPLAHWAIRRFVGRRLLREHRVEEYRHDGKSRTLFRMYFGPDGMPVRTWAETATREQVMDLLGKGGDPSQTAVIAPEEWPDAVLLNSCLACSTILTEPIYVLDGQTVKVEGCGHEFVIRVEDEKKEIDDASH